MGGHKQARLLTSAFAITPCQTTTLIIEKLFAEWRPGQTVLVSKWSQLAIVDGPGMQQCHHPAGGDALVVRPGLNVDVANHVEGDERIGLSVGDLVRRQDDLNGIAGGALDLDVPAVAANIDFVVPALPQSVSTTAPSGA